MNYVVNRKMFQQMLAVLFHTFLVLYGQSSVTLTVFLLDAPEFESESLN